MNIDDTTRLHKKLHQIENDLSTMRFGYVIRRKVTQITITSFTVCVAL